MNETAKEVRLLSKVLDCMIEYDMMENVFEHISNDKELVTYLEEIVGPRDLIVVED